MEMFFKFYRDIVKGDLLDTNFQNLILKGNQTVDIILKFKGTLLNFTEKK